jgi:hypothetical protein
MKRESDPSHSLLILPAPGTSSTNLFRAVGRQCRYSRAVTKGKGMVTEAQIVHCTYAKPESSAASTPLFYSWPREKAFLSQLAGLGTPLGHT